MSQDLHGKKILLGLTGGIAAYKTAFLCRELVKSGADVRVVMTLGAQAFITPLTFQALSGNPVHTELLDDSAEAGMGHIELAKWPDLIVIAPATANFIAKYAQGIADDLLSTLLLATIVPVAIVPAMNQAMWKNPLTQKNLNDLRQLFSHRLAIFGPAVGEQACGDVGLGRMLESHEIKKLVSDHFNASKPEQRLLNKTIVITAGPTQEAIDPVRYISNHSSGKMGYSLARSCQSQGAHVILISGPTHIETPVGVDKKNVISALDMYESTLSEIDKQVDVFIACAAVADYRPLTIGDKKIKKSNDAAESISIELKQNPDIVAAVANHKYKPFTVGFAAETDSVIQYAQGKLKAKGLDMIIANDVSKVGIGFNSDLNEVSLITKDNIIELPCQSKDLIADKIIEQVILALK